MIPTPVDLNLGVGLAAEQLVESAVLFVGKERLAGVEGTAHGVERATGTAAVSAGLLLDALPTLIQLVTSQSDELCGSTALDASESLTTAAALNPVNPFSTTTSMLSRQVLGYFLSHVTNT